MARKSQPKSKASKSSHARKNSPELGDGDLTTRYNSRTGRPIRDSAGRKSLNPLYLDSIEAIEANDDDDDDDDVQSEQESEEEDSKKKKKKPKRKRTPSPPLPDLDPLPLCPDDVPSREPTPLVDDEQDNQSITLTFHVPKGFTGPFVVKLDRALLSTEQPRKRQRLASVDTDTSAFSTESDVDVAPRTGSLFKGDKSKSSKRTVIRKRSFVKLPPEIRNQIYRLVFVTKGEINFSHPVNFSRSAALLRTCKQVCDEGRSILYSENKFAFARNSRSRAPYWSPQEKEVGYQDMRVFLKSIRSRNISLLRRISINFTDAAPSSTPYLSHEDRRFVRDEHLIDCLRLISSNANLKEIEVSFYGRKCLVRNDYRFLDALREIKADKVSLECNDRSWYSSKVEAAVKISLMDTMVRQHKLYEHEPDPSE